jgi:hypothetical protein
MDASAGSRYPLADRSVALRVSDQGQVTEGLTHSPHICERLRQRPEEAGRMPVFFDCLLYFTSFGAVFTMFASLVSIGLWLLKALWSWVTVEPQPEAGKPQDLYTPNLNNLKRAGQ